MNESEFDLKVDSVIEHIEEQLDELEVDFDYETAGGILTMTFENGSKIIINRQTPVKQIWVATKSGGYHFNHDNDTDTWLKDDDGTELFTALNRAILEQSDEQVGLTAA